VAVNCPAIPRDLIESELFGHKRGSFSGASVDYLGLFRAAEGATLLLNEVTEMNLETQSNCCGRSRSVPCARWARLPKSRSMRG